MDEQTLYGIGRNLILTSQNIIAACRKQNYEDAIAGMNVLILSFGTWSESVLGLIAQDESHMYFPEAEQVASTLTQLMDAQKAKDYVLLADYLELLALPLVMQVQDGLRAIFGNLGSVYRQDVFETNLSCLKKYVQEIQNATPYELEETNAGYATVSLTDAKGSYYLHSNVNPMLEAQQMASSYYSPDINTYWVVGLGLGYHIKALLDMGDYIQVRVYESDIRTLRTMLGVLDISAYLLEGRLELVYDADQEILIGDLKKQTTEKIVLLGSSIRNIRNESIQQQIMQYFIKESGVRKNENLMASNFYQNIKKCDGLIDDIKNEIFQNKTVFVISAGPSLLKNIELLKEKPKNSVILAVSTVYRKLLGLGIRPDYVIHSDAQKKTYFHLKGIEETIPLLVLSTAYEGCARLYPGKSYMICQEGYDLAEHYAKEHNATCFATGGSVATIAVSVAVSSGAQKVALVGQDLAYTDGLAHAKGVSKQAIGQEQNLIQVPGYNGGMVDSTLIFADFIKWFSDFAKTNDPEQKILVNATEGGAKIAGIKQQSLADIIAGAE